MALISILDATLRVGRKALFTGANLRLGSGERIGLIGPNGSGKTSLLRLLNGEIELDAGEIHRRQGLRVGYLSQHLELAGGKSLLQFVRDAVPGREKLEAEVQQVEAKLASGLGTDEEVIELSAELAELHERLAHFEADYADHVALQILSGLGFRDRDKDRDLGELSGGWRVRAVLAALLFMRPDVLLLDEPTNHLDLPSVAWFSSFLRRWPRTFILISHDREFLNEQIDRVVSFEPEGLRQYVGDLDSYERQRNEERQVLENRAKNLQREREKTEEFIQRFRAQAHKAKAVQSRIKALARMEDVQTLTEHEEVRFSFPSTPKSSKLVLTCENLGKRYGEHRVFEGVDLNVMRGERIGVIGVNGAGKTTLLKVLAAELAPDAGTISLGHHVEIGFYAQHHAEALHADSTVFDEVARVTKDLSPTQIRNILGGLLFGADDIDKPIRVLSGGERARVALAKLLLNPKNLLLMDEPTNHLDLRSSERLAEALTRFDGTLIFVSHNRSFVRRLATRIWNVAEGTVETYPGSLDEYMTSSIRQLGISEGNEGIAGHDPTGASATTHKRNRSSEKERKRREAEQRNLRRNVLGPLEKKVQSLEAEIASLEEAQSQRSALLSDPDVFADTERSASLMREFQSTASKLEELTSTWEALSTQLEEARAELEASSALT